MKHLSFKTLILALLLLNAFYTTAYSQSPTKEQTIEFLKSYYENKGEMICSDDRYPESVSNSFKLTSIKDLGNCEYEVKYEWEYDFRKYDENLRQSYIHYYTVRINLSKVEAANYFYTKKGDCRLYYIRLKGVPGVKFSSKQESIYYSNQSLNSSETNFLNEVDIPAGRQSDTNEISAEIVKINRAFDHLRKLCGAPDPIKF